jgi:hypothetical protein
MILAGVIFENYFGLGTLTQQLAVKATALA